jgi:hypothetical protein
MCGSQASSHTPPLRAPDAGRKHRKLPPGSAGPPADNANQPRRLRERGCNREEQLRMCLATAQKAGGCTHCTGWVVPTRSPTTPHVVRMSHPAFPSHAQLPVPHTNDGIAYVIV